MNTSFHSRYLSVEDAVNYSDICRTTLYKLMRLPSPSIESISLAPPGKRGKRLVDRKSLDRYLASFRLKTGVTRRSEAIQQIFKATRNLPPQSVWLVSSQIRQAQFTAVSPHGNALREVLAKAARELESKEFEALFLGLLPIAVQCRRAAAAQRRKDRAEIQNHPALEPQPSISG